MIIKNAQLQKKNVNLYKQAKYALVNVIVYSVFLQRTNYQILIIVYSVFLQHPLLPNTLI